MEKENDNAGWGPTIAAVIVLVLIVSGAYFGGMVGAAHKTAGQNVGGAGFSVAGNAFFLSAGGTGAGFASSTPGEQSATSTGKLWFSTGSATSTLTGFSNYSTSVDLNMNETASSSATAWIWTVQFSDNFDQATGNGDWYNEDCSQVSSTVLVTHGATPCIHSWTPGITTVDLKKNVSIAVIQSRWFRVNFQVTGAGGALYVKGIPKEVTPN